MKNTAMGFHTFSMFKRLSEGESFSLDGKFLSYMQNSGRIKRYPIKTEKMLLSGIEYVYKNDVGIRWLLLSLKTKNDFTIYGVKAIITPQVLLNKNYIDIAQDNDMEKIKDLFNVEASKISDTLKDIETYSMSRADYCINFYLDELKTPCTPAQMMALIKRGNIPAHFVERTEYDRISHRQKSHKNSFYLTSGSVVVNCYDKHVHLLGETKHPCKNKTDAKTLIRFEVQCGYSKLYAFSKFSRQEVEGQKTDADMTLEEAYHDLTTYQCIAIPINAVLSARASSETIQKYFKKVVQLGDYYSLEMAKRIIQSSDFHQKKKDRLIDALVLTSDCRGIYKVKNGIRDKDLEIYNRALRDLNCLGINPVTIPRDWGIKFIPNLLNAYYDRRADEHMKEQALQNLREMVAENRLFRKKRGK